MWNDPTLVLATSNPGKLAEFTEIFAPFGTTVVGQGTLGIDAPEETGRSFIENAILKARHASRIANRPALADDSGLVVPALNGEPGLYSARYAGINATDADNVARLITALTALPQDARMGHYVCALALVRHASDPDPMVTVGRWHGQLLVLPRGHFGFGYDPLFVPDGATLTAAEMTPEDKHAQSHRGQAVARLLQDLR